MNRKRIEQFKHNDNLVQEWKQCVVGQNLGDYDPKICYGCGYDIDKCECDVFD